MRSQKTSKEVRAKGSSEGRKAVFKYLSEYKKKFRICGFKYTVMFVRGKDVADYYAEVVMHGNRVRIYFNEDLMDRRPSSIEDTVVHELLHVVMYKLLDKAHALVKRHVRKVADRRRLENRFEKLEHDIIDRVMPAIMKG